MTVAKKIIKKMLKGCLSGSCLNTGSPTPCSNCKYMKWGIKKYGYNILEMFDYKDLEEVEKQW